MSDSEVEEVTELSSSNPNAAENFIRSMSVDEQEAVNYLDLESNPHIAPIRGVELPDDYRPPSESGEFNKERRYDVFQRAVGGKNIQSVEDFYAEQMSDMMEEAQNIANSNATWSTIYKYVNKGLVFIAIIITAIITIVTIDDRNYPAAILAAIVGAILTIHEMFGIGDIGLKYFTQSHRAMYIKNDLMDTLCEDNLNTHEMKVATQQARKRLDNLNYEVFEAGYGPRSAIQAVRDSGTGGGKYDTDFSEYLNMEEGGDGS